MLACIFRLLFALVLPTGAKDNHGLHMLSRAHCRHGVRLQGLQLGARGAECMGDFVPTAMSNEGLPVWKLLPKTVSAAEHQIERDVEGTGSRALFLFYLRTLEWRGWACGWKVGAEPFYLGLAGPPSWSPVESQRNGRRNDMSGNIKGKHDHTRKFHFPSSSVDHASRRLGKKGGREVWRSFGRDGFYASDIPSVTRAIGAVGGLRVGEPVPMLRASCLPSDWKAHALAVARGARFTRLHNPMRAPKDPRSSVGAETSVAVRMDDTSVAAVVDMHTITGAHADTVESANVTAHGRADEKARSLLHKKHVKPMQPYCPKIKLSCGVDGENDVSKGGHSKMDYPDIRTTLAHGGFQMRPCPANVLPALGEYELLDNNRDVRPFYRKVVARSSRISTVQRTNRGGGSLFFYFNEAYGKWVVGSKLGVPPFTLVADVDRSTAATIRVTTSANRSMGGGLRRAIIDASASAPWLPTALPPGSWMMATRTGPMSDFSHQARLKSRTYDNAYGFRRVFPGIVVSCPAPTSAPTSAPTPVPTPTRSPLSISTQHTRVPSMLLTFAPRSTVAVPNPPPGLPAIELPLWWATRGKKCVPLKRMSAAAAATTAAALRVAQRQGTAHSRPRSSFAYSSSSCVCATGTVLLRQRESFSETRAPQRPQTRFDTALRVSLGRYVQRYGAFGHSELRPVYSMRLNSSSCMEQWDIVNQVAFAARISGNDSHHRHVEWPVGCERWLYYVGSFSAAGVGAKHGIDSENDDSHHQIRSLSHALQSWKGGWVLSTRLRPARDNGGVGNDKLTKSAGVPGPSEWLARAPSRALTPDRLLLRDAWQARHGDVWSTVSGLEVVCAPPAPTPAPRPVSIPLQMRTPAPTPMPTQVSIPKPIKSKFTASSMVSRQICNEILVSGITSGSPGAAIMGAYRLLNRNAAQSGTDKKKVRPLVWRQHRRGPDGSDCHFCQSYYLYYHANYSLWGFSAIDGSTDFDMIKLQRGRSHAALPTDANEVGGGIGRWRVRNGDSGVFEAAQNVHVRCRSPTRAPFPQFMPNISDLSSLSPKVAPITVPPIPADWTLIGASNGQYRRQSVLQAPLSTHSSQSRPQVQTRAPSPLPTTAAGQMDSVHFNITIQGVAPSQLGFRGGGGTYDDNSAANGNETTSVIVQQRNAALRRRFEAALAYAIDHADTNNDHRRGQINHQLQRPQNTLTFEPLPPAAIVATKASALWYRGAHASRPWPRARWVVVGTEIDVVVYTRPLAAVYSKAGQGIASARKHLLDPPHSATTYLRANSNAAGDAATRLSSVAHKAWPSQDRYAQQPSETSTIADIPSFSVNDVNEDAQGGWRIGLDPLRFLLAPTRLKHSIAPALRRFGFKSVADTTVSISQLQLGTTALTNVATPGQSRAPMLSNNLNTASMGHKLYSDLGRETFLSVLPPKSTFNVMHVTTSHTPQSSATLNTALRSVHHTMASTFIRSILLGLTFVAGLVMAYCAASRYKLLPEIGSLADSHAKAVCHDTYQSCVLKQHDWPQVSRGSSGYHQQCMDASLYDVGVVADSNQVWPDAIVESHC